MLCHTDSGELYISIGARIRDARKDRGLTQIELASRLNVNQAVVSYWETDKSLPTLENAIAISNVLDISLDHIVLGKPILKKELADGPPLELIEERPQKSEQKRRIVFKIKDLPEQDLKLMEEMIDRLLGSSRGKSKVSKRVSNAG